jgi:cyclopropane fatty-acyl-phospholipid synthase-like methyltransferase
MDEQEQYMADFGRIFEPLDRWGIGSEADTLKALDKLPFSPQTILEIGCGKGIATQILAKHSSAMITAVDNYQPALARLSEVLTDAGLEDRVQTCCASMDDLPFAAESFDVIWAEGCAYVIGVKTALEQWRELLRNNGVLVFSDLVWQTAKPSAQALSFWNKEYPDMSTNTVRIEQAQAAGYRVLDSFALSEQAWQAYYGPLQRRVEVLKPDMAGSAALRDIETELTVYQQKGNDFAYQMLVLQKTR